MLYVLLNTERMENVKGPNVGEVPPFISVGPRVAAGWTRDHLRTLGGSLGRPVPAFVARLFGWRVHKMGT